MKKPVIQIRNRKSLDNIRRIDHHDHETDKISLVESTKMTGEDRKRIIFDAVNDYILSCNEEKATKFIEEITDIIIESYIRIMA